MPKRLTFVLTASPYSGQAAGDLVPGVRLIELGEIAAAMADCDRTLIF